MVAQAALSLRLVWADTAFPDEALYLWAGHMEWSHWLYGAPTPAFQTYFSGAPAIYPPLGALVDTYGGLAGARLLSLAFMLTTSCLLHGATRRIFDRRSANFATILFVGLAATQYLGAFATYDAMALFLVALATWLGVRAADAGRRGEVILLLMSGCSLTLADATKYAAALFTPVVLCLVISYMWWRRGRKRGIGAGLIVFWTLSLALAGVLVAGGPAYWQGIRYTTLNRSAGNAAVPFLLSVSIKWEGLVVALALLGAATVACTARSRAGAAVGWTLVIAAFLVPIEQARIHTYTSLFKHVGYGAWFAAIVGGYALASLLRAVPPNKAVTALRVSAATALIVGLPGIPWAASHFGWPNTGRLVPVMRNVLDHTSGPFLADDRGNVLDYYLPEEMARRQVTGTWFFAFNDPRSGRHLIDRPAYAAAIRERYFSVIMLQFWDTVGMDDSIRRDVSEYHGYRLVADFPYPATGTHGNFMIWVRGAGQ